MSVPCLLRRSRRWPSRPSRSPAAQADHIAPTVTATLTLGKAVKDCNAEGLCARGRRATVSWNASCGPAAPADALREVDVGIYGVRPNGTRFPYDGEAPKPRTRRYRVDGDDRRARGPILRRGDGDLQRDRHRRGGPEVEHTAKATSGPTEQFYLPPQLVDYRTTRAGFCGVNVPTASSTSGSRPASTPRWSTCCATAQPR